jgi:hypothetical protein
MEPQDPPAGSRPDGPTPKLRWYQFRLRSLLLFVLLVSVLLSLYLTITKRSRERGNAYTAIHQLGGRIMSKYVGWSYLLLGQHSADVIGVEVGSDEMLQCLTAFPEVEYVVISPCCSKPGSAPATDSGLSCLEKMTKLKTLTVADCPITDAGLVHLYGLHNLKLFTLKGTKVTDLGIRKFQQALPNCYISQSQGNVNALPH